MHTSKRTERFRWEERFREEQAMGICYRLLESHDGLDSMDQAEQLSYLRWPS
jgi:hypothetical protein